MNTVPPPQDRLSAADLTFLIEILDRQGETDALRSLLLDEESLHQILDLPAVLKAVLEAPAIVEISPRLYFYVVVRHVFRQAGIEEVEAARYVAGVLSTRTGAPEGRSSSAPQYVIDFLQRIETAPAGARFEWWVAAGDHFLVLTGLFSEFIRRRCEDRGAPGIDFYEGFGRRAYREAGDHPKARRKELSGTLHLLSDAFPEARRALNRVAEDYLFLAS